MPHADTPSGRSVDLLRAARLCFLDRGFVRTSISDIVAIAGGSRATLYEEFGSKEGLFAALIGSIIEQMRLPDIASGPPRKVLREVGVSYMEQLMDPEALALYRVVSGESAHIRQLGPEIFAAGPQAAAAALAERFAGWKRDGVLHVNDPERAAVLFLAMIEGDLHRAAILWSGTPSADDIVENVDAAVDLFLNGAQPIWPTAGATLAPAAER